MADTLRIAGHLDRSSLRALSGWAFDPEAPDTPVEIEVREAEELVCTLHADEFRQDLRNAGYGEGRHGFTVELPQERFTRPLVVLHVRVRHTGQELAGSPVTLSNTRVLLNPPTLDEVGRAVSASAAAAKEAGELAALATWLLRQLDVVLGRQASLQADAAARTQSFLALIGGPAALSDMLRNAAAAVLARYAPLHLPELGQPDVSVIVPVHDHFDYTYRCLESVLAHRPQASLEVIVVDDGSTDETLYAGFLLSGGIRLLRTGGNGGFVTAVNAGAAVARGRLLFLLNNDTQVQPGWLDELVDTFTTDGAVGIAGSKLVYPDGRLQEVGGIIWRQGTGHNWGRGDDAGRPEYNFLRDADYVSGAALMIPRALWQQLGGLSAEYAPAYYEDTDLCFRVRAAGRRVVVQPRSVVVHHEGVTAGVDVEGTGAKRFQRVNQRTFVHAWSDVLQSHPLAGSDPRLAAERLVTKRALFIDNTVPTPDQDAGSNAAFEHMRALQRLGYQVYFVPSDNMARIPPYTEALERIGIQCYYAPFYWSVEEIFRRESLRFDLFYLHRVGNMTKYAPMIRQRFPAARLVFNVADLHHLRVQREAALHPSAALEASAAALRQAEMAALAAADAVIVHSSHEAGMLTAAGLATPVHVMPWTVPLRPDPAPFAERAGVVMIGGYNHPPNVDAAEWLVHEVLPLLHAQAPGIECQLVGSQMPPGMQALARPGVTLLGQVPDLAPVLGQVRLSVAPLRYGAGLKGKVLASLACGVPVVMTAIAAEGMDLPTSFDAVIADSAEAFAAAMLRLHEDDALWAVLHQAGLDYVAATCSAERIDALLAAAITGAPAPAQPQAAAEPVTLEQGRPPRKRGASRPG